MSERGPGPIATVMVLAGIAVQFVITGVAGALVEEGIVQRPVR